jgi:hypothetical protein
LKYLLHTLADLFMTKRLAAIQGRDASPYFLSEQRVMVKLQAHKIHNNLIRRPT